MTAKAPKTQEKAKPAGISFSALGPIECSVEVPGAVDPATGDPAVITFSCERPTHGIALEMSAAQEDVKAREGTAGEGLLAGFAVVCSDVRGVSDFPRRRADETREAFRERFTEHFRNAGGTAEVVISMALTDYMERVQPKVSFRSFPL